MITTSELNKQLTNLIDEFLGVEESGDVTEAFRWIVSTQEFLRGLLEETETMKHLTAREREIISGAEQANTLKQHGIKLLLQERIRGANQKGGAGMNEDKQAILNAFLPALKLTRAGKDVVKLIYDKDSEKVWIDYVGGIDAVNVRADSGAAMLVDVLRTVMYG